MFIISTLTLLISNALTKKCEYSILFSRSLMFFIITMLIFDNLTINLLAKGLAIYSGLFTVIANVQGFAIFVFFIWALIVTLTYYYNSSIKFLILKTFNKKKSLNICSHHVKIKFKQHGSLPQFTPKISYLSKNSITRNFTTSSKFNEYLSNNKTNFDLTKLNLKDRYTDNNLVNIKEKFSDNTLVNIKESLFNDNIVSLKKNQKSFDNLNNKYSDLWCNQQGVFKLKQENVNNLSETNNAIFEETIVEEKLKNILNNNNITNNDYMNYDEVFNFLNNCLTEILNGNLSYLEVYNSIILFLVWLLYVKCGLSYSYLVGLYTAKLHLLKILFAYKTYLWLDKNIANYSYKWYSKIVSSFLSNYNNLKKKTGKKTKNNYFFLSTALLKLINGNNAVKSLKLKLNNKTKNCIKHYKDFYNYFNLNLYPNNLTVYIKNNFILNRWEGTARQSDSGQDNMVFNRVERFPGEVMSSRALEINPEAGPSNWHEYNPEAEASNMNSYRALSHRIPIIEFTHQNPYNGPPYILSKQEYRILVPYRGTLDLSQYIQESTNLNLSKRPVYEYSREDHKDIGEYNVIRSPYLSANHIGDDVTYRNLTNIDWFSDETLKSFTYDTNSVNNSSWDKYDEIVEEAKRRGISFDENNCIARGLRHYKQRADFVKIIQDYYEQQAETKIDPSSKKRNTLVLKPKDQTIWATHKRYADYMFSQEKALFRYIRRQSYDQVFKWEHKELKQFRTDDTVFNCFYETDVLVCKHWWLFLYVNGIFTKSNMDKYYDNSADLELYNAFLEWQIANNSLLSWLNDRGFL